MNTINADISFFTLPIKHNLGVLYIVSLLIAVLATVASLGGLFLTDVFYPTEALIQSFVPNDLLNLVLGVPILLGSMWFARRDKLIGLLFWPGALFYMIYNYLVPVFCLPVNVGFVLHLLLVVLSIYAAAALVASIDGPSVQQRLNGLVRERFTGGMMVALGVLFALFVVGGISGAIINQTPVSDIDRAVHIADAMMIPTWIICGMLLWRHKALGYVAGVGLLFQLCMLFVGLIAFFIVQPLLTTVPFALVDMLVILVMSTLALVPFGVFLRGILK